MSRTLVLARADSEHSADTPESLRELFNRYRTGMEIHHWRSGNVIGTLEQIRIVEHENGAFIECDVKITSPLTAQLPDIHADQVIRRSLLETIGEPAL